MDVAHGPPAKKKPKGSSKWSLDPRLEVSLRVRDASSSTGDQKVSVAGAGVGRVGGGQPVASGLLLLSRIDPQPPSRGARGLRRPGFLFDPSVQQMFTVHLLHARHCRHVVSPLPGTGDTEGIKIGEAADPTGLTS